MKVYRIDANTDASRDLPTDTGWLATDWITEDTSFYISGTWAGFNVVLDISNEPYVKGVARTKFLTVGTYTAATPTAYGIPREIGGRIRFRRVDTGAITGVAFVCISPGKDRLGNLIGVGPEPTGAV